MSKSREQSLRRKIKRGVLLPEKRTIGGILLGYNLRKKSNGGNSKKTKKSKKYTRPTSYIYKQI